MDFLNIILITSFAAVIFAVIYMIWLYFSNRKMLKWETVGKETPKHKTEDKDILKQDIVDKEMHKPKIEGGNKNKKIKISVGFWQSVKFGLGLSLGVSLFILLLFFLFVYVLDKAMPIIL